jgi:YbgC/YbaW family acyl-CoA thioester hydrolase
MQCTFEHVVCIYELDIYGHANHVQYLHWLEEGRERLFLTRGLSFVTLGTWDRRLVIANVNLDYRAPLASGDRILIETSLARLGRTSVRFGHRIETPEGNVALSGEVTMVFVDAAGRPAAVPDRFREAVADPPGG